MSALLFLGFLTRTAAQTVEAAPPRFSRDSAVFGGDSGLLYSFWAKIRGILDCGGGRCAQASGFGLNLEKSHFSAVNSRFFRIQPFLPPLTPEKSNFRQNKRISEVLRHFSLSS